MYRCLLTVLCFLLSLLLTSFSSAESQLRFLHGSRQDYEVTKFALEVEVIEDLAHTTIWAELYNPNSFNQEAELIVPLPDGSTISHYAIDVKGEMRPASVVDKSKALKAYEEIKARNIDPGIVEKKKNNEFRVRIFPIFPKKTRRLQLTFTTRSTAQKGHYHYKLPIKLDSSISSTNVQIVAPNSKLKSKHFKLSAPNEYPENIPRSHLTDTIHILTPVPKVNTAIVQQSSSSTHSNIKYPATTYYKIHIPKHIPTKQLFQPKHITLLWDNSGSLDTTLLGKRINLLEQYFKKNPNTQVELHSIGYDSQKLGTFSIKNSSWTKLKTAISSIKHDAAFDFTTVQSLPETLLKKPTLVLTSSKNFSRLQWHTKLKTLSLIDLQSNTPEDIIEQICYQRLRPLHAPKAFTLNDKDSRVLEIISPGELPDAGLKIAYEHDTKQQFIADFTLLETVTKSLHPIISRSLAQRQFDRLKAEKQPKQLLTNFATTHRLVSDYTSMIVLETLDDYVKYKIPPLQTADREKYDKIIKEEREESNSEKRAKAEYHKSYHPWHTYQFYSANLNISIWDKSLDRFFLPRHINQKNRKLVLDWARLALETERHFHKVKTQEAFNSTAKKLAKLEEQRKKFFYLPSQYPMGNPKDKKIQISMRGIVKDPKNHELPAGTDLKEFAHKFDRPIIDLYRNSQKFTFNLLSKSYQKTPLQAGDMLVASEKNRYLSFQFQGANDDLRDHPYILSKGTDLSVYEYFNYNIMLRSGDPFGGSDPFSSPESHKPEEISATKVSTSLNGKTANGEFSSSFQPVTKEQWQQFETAIIKQPKEAYANYLTLRSEQHRDTHFFIQAAEYLYNNNQQKLARKVLSNIIAGEESSTVATKRYLYWLMHFQDYAYALSYLEDTPQELISTDLQFIQFYLLHTLEKLNWEAVQKFSDSPLYACYSSTLNFKPEYDIRILASAETNGVSSFLKIDYTPPKGVTLPLADLYKHGLYSIRADGVEEHTMKQAIPGTYSIKLSNKIIATYRIEITTKNNAGEQITKTITRHTDGKGGWLDLRKFDLTLP